MKIKSTSFFCLMMIAGWINGQIVVEQAAQTISIQEEKTHYQTLAAADRAPGDVIVEDDFSDATNWNFYTESGTTPQWQIVATTPPQLVTYMEAMASPTAANGFAALNAIQYLLPPLTELPIDALLEYGTPMDCSGAMHVTLQFFMAYRAFNYDQIFVEVTNNDWAPGFGTAQYELFSDMPTNDPTIQMTILKDITSIAAGYPSVKVRFRFRELYAIDAYGCGYGAMVDDFKVKEAWNYDQELTASYHRSGIGEYMPSGLDYYLIPPSQIAQISFSGVTQNLGGLVQPGAKLNVEVSGAGAFSASSATVDLPIAASDSLACPGVFVPAAEGLYDIKYWVDCDNPEQETINDSSSRTINVNPYLYGRDNGIGGSSIGNVVTNLNNPLLIGNVMDVFGDDTIVAIDIVIANFPSNVGKLIFGQVMIYDEGSGSFVYEGQTIDHTILSSENGESITIPFDSPIEIFEGQSILVLAGHYGGATEAQFRMAQSVEDLTVLGYISGATDPFFLASPSAIMVRARFGYEPIDDSGVDELVDNGLSLGQNYPNPFEKTTTITFSVEEPTQLQLEIVDLAGNIVRVVDLGLISAGPQQYNFGAEELANGTYFYTLKSSTTTLTKEMIIVK